MEIAKAVSHSLRILILDEPTAALPDREIEELFAIMRDLAARGVGMVHISHRLDEIHRIANRVTDRGKGFRDKMIELITSQAKHTKDDIKVTGNPAYIAADTPTGGKAIIINVVVPASPKDTDATYMINVRVE